ncbi:MAG: thioredoxin domain-containing protein, partial [Nitrosopumilus sp.]|nr:thioredoxin domain-containing protein [Nitrosopumilus sp.]
EQPYFCIVHPWMEGIIIVQEAGAEEMMKETSEEEMPMEKEEMMIEKMMVGDVDVTMSPPIEGSADAPVTIIEFGDYQCPKCEQWYTNEKSTITADYIDTGKAKLYFVDFPFLGQDSDNAANASYCADDQGKFWEYHNALYSNQGGINEGWADVNALKQFAADLGLDTAAFNECVDSDKHKDRVDYNRMVGASNGVEGTPVFILVGSDGQTQRIDGPQSSDIFAGVIDTMLGEPIKEAMAQEETMMENESRQVIKIGSTALWVEISGDKVYVSNPEDGTIIVIDKKTNKVVNTISAIKGIGVLEIVEDKNKIYATAIENPRVYVYDLMTGKSLGSIDIGEATVTQYSKGDETYGNREYVTFDTNAIGLAYNPNNELLYAVHSTVDHVNYVDTNTDTNLGHIAVGRTPLLITIDESRNIGYVTNVETNNVSVLDLESNTLIKNLNTGFAPDQLIIANDRLYVSHHASPHVSVVDLETQSIETEIQLKAPTHAIAFDENRNIVYVTYLPESGITGKGFLNMVEFIDAKSNKVIGSMDIAANPFIVAIDGANSKLYATIIKDGNLIVVDLKQQDIDLGLTTTQSEITQSESEDEGGGCLIATAAYGTELAPQVQFLREIRDNTVMSTSSGAAFMSGFNQLYYSFSPTIADMERENPMFQETVRAFITPMISTLSIMTLADNGSEVEVLGLGISVIALNLGMYIAAPALIGFKVHKHFKSRK